MSEEKGQAWTAGCYGCYQRGGGTVTGGWDASTAAVEQWKSEHRLSSPACRGYSTWSNIGPAGPTQ